MGKTTLLSVVSRLCNHSPAGDRIVGRRRASFVCNETRNAEAVFDETRGLSDPRHGVAGAFGQHVGVIGGFRMARLASLWSSINPGGRQGQGRSYLW